MQGCSIRLLPALSVSPKSYGKASISSKIASFSDFFFFPLEKEKRCISSWDKPAALQPRSSENSALPKAVPNGIYLRENNKFLVKLKVFLISFFLCRQSLWRGCVFFLWCHHFQIQVSPGITFPALLQMAISDPKGLDVAPKSFGSFRHRQAAASQNTHEMALEPQPWCWEKSTLGIWSQKYLMLQTQG